MKLRLLLVLVVAVALTFSGSTQAALRTVTLTGQQAPGAPAGSTFISLSHNVLPFLGPALNNAGHTAFSASAGSMRGIWSDASGSLSSVAISDTQPPGAPVGALFGEFLNPLLNDAGRTGFYATMYGSAVTNAGFWSENSGGLNVVVRKGSLLPGVGAGVSVLTVFYPSMNDFGQPAFRAQLTGAGVTTENNVGIWAEKAGGLTLMARAGGQAPGMPAGVNYDSFPATPVLINEGGAIAFRGFLTGAGVTPANDVAIWVDRSGALSLVAREGDAVPGVSGANFSFIGDHALNASGRVAFAGLMSGVPAASNSAIFSEGVGTLAVAARKGNAAPGAAVGVNFNGFGSPLLNDDGHVAFSATLIGAGVTTVNDTGIWSQRGGALNLVAREGSQAPGAPAGLNFSTFANSVLNSASQMAFTATLTGAGVTTANDGGIWVQGLGGDLRLMAREGGQLEVSSGVNRTIAELFFAGGVNNEDGRRSGFNDLGELAFLAKFTDGSSGIFVSDVAKASPGDFDGDADVDGADFLVWQRGVGLTDTGSPANGDANADGNVDGADLTIWKSKFAAPPTAVVGAAVPEPGAALLGVFALACVSCVWRSRPS